MSSTRTEPRAAGTTATPPDPLELLDRVVAAMPGGEERPQQRTMVSEVSGALADGRHLAVQGPTGVGKSIGYLLPVIAAAARGRRTVVVTSSRALQDQLARDDLPWLEANAGVPFSHAVLKGRSNYLCRAAEAEVRVVLGGGEQTALDLGGSGATAGTPSKGELAGALREELEALLGWAQRTTTGEQTELATAPSDDAWRALSVGPGECVGRTRCAHADECCSEQARDRAASADIVVVNAHLYAAHLGSGGALLPEHDVLVIDEAHEFEDAMVGALGVSVGAGRLHHLARAHDRAVADAPEVGRALTGAADAMADALAVAHADAVDDHRSGRLRAELPEDVAAALATAAIAADRALASLRKAREAAEGSRATTAVHRVERGMQAAGNLLDDLATLVEGRPAKGQVRWIAEERVRGGSLRHTLNLTRIDVAATLRSMAWERSAGDEVADADTGPDEAPGGPTVVCCSATLDPGTPARLGLDARYVAVDSPFDFRRNSLLYVPRMPRPSSQEWPEAVAEEVAHVLQACGGRTLALFTSRRMLLTTAASVRERLDGRPILVQGEAPNPVLQQRFLADEHTSLFATASFWTGISSPGTTCSAVVVDKLPFPVPTDPIVEARCDMVGDERAFSEVSVPAAGIQLAQGVGRLIRTATDRGVVAVLDPRLAEAGYRRRILDRLPRMRRTRERADLDDFVAGLDLSPYPGVS